MDFLTGEQDNKRVVDVSVSANKSHARSHAFLAPKRGFKGATFDPSGAGDDRKHLNLGSGSWVGPTRPPRL